MIGQVARAMMALAEACLGERRRDWAHAMRAEFAFAARDGKSLAFASGCLVSAICVLPRHAEGRFAIASHVIALGLFPVAALLFLGTASAFPFLPPGRAGIGDLLAGSVEPLQLLMPWNRGFAPGLALLIWGLGAGHVLMPWFIVERDWARAGLLAGANSAATVTLFLFTGVLLLDFSFMVLPVAGLFFELTAVWLLYQWHISLGAPPGAQAT